MNCPVPFLAKYKHSLGVPKKGFHEKRIGPYAFNDMIGTVFIALILTFFIKPLKYMKNLKYNESFLLNFLINLIIIFIIGELLHYLFCVDTAFIIQIKNLFK